MTDSKIDELTGRLSQLELVLATIPEHDYVYIREVRSTYDQVLRDLTRETEKRDAI